MSTQNYREQDFEDHVVEHLTSVGVPPPAPARLRQGPRPPPRRGRLVRPGDPTRRVRPTAEGSTDDTDRNLSSGSPEEIGKWGTLHVLRKGVKDRGVRTPSRLLPTHLAISTPSTRALYRQEPVLRRPATQVLEAERELPRSLPSSSTASPSSLQNSRTPSPGSRRACHEAVRARTGTRRNPSSHSDGASPTLPSATRRSSTRPDSQGTEDVLPPLQQGDRGRGQATP